MKGYRFIVLVFCVNISCFFVRAQSVLVPTLTVTPKVQGAVCPNIPIDYQLQVPDGWTGYSVLWEIVNSGGDLTNNGKNGHVSGTPTNSEAFIIWDDDSFNNQAEVTVTISGGNASPNPSVITVTQPILSVAGQSFESGYQTNYTISRCNTLPVTLTVSKMYVNNTSKEVDNYQWDLPSGWLQSGTNHAGTIYTTSNSISVIGNQCT